MIVIMIFTKKSILYNFYWKNFMKNDIIINISNMSKVFTDFFEIKFMNKKVTIGILVSIAIIVGIMAILAENQDQNKIEVENSLDEKISLGNSSEINKKLEEIEKIADENEYEVLPRDWQTSGPFQIDRKEYALGEKIFLRIGGLKFSDKGQVAVMRPLNDTHYEVYLTIPFDGSQKQGFNYYLDPQLSKARELCSIDDVLGKWTLVFRGTNYANLNFEIVNKTVPGTSWEPVC